MRCGTTTFTASGADADDGRLVLSVRVRRAIEKEADPCCLKAPAIVRRSAFAVESAHPCPSDLCYAILRRRADGGGDAINLDARFEHLGLIS